MDGQVSILAKEESGPQEDQRRGRELPHWFPAAKAGLSSERLFP